LAFALNIQIFNAFFVFAESGNSEQINEYLQWLQNNKAPWDTVVQYWEKTTVARYNSLLRNDIAVHDYMEQFPAFRDSNGHLLVRPHIICNEMTSVTRYFTLKIFFQCNTDFTVLHPSAVNKLFTEYNFLSAFIRESLSTSDKDEIDGSFNSGKFCV